MALVLKVSKIGLEVLAVFLLETLAVLAFNESTNFFSDIFLNL
jgi:hypothetical protein